MPTYEPGKIRIEILDAAGDPAADGPLVTIQSLDRSRELDRIGGISFTVPASDPRTQYIQAGRHYKVYHADLGYLGEFIHKSDSVAPGEKPTLRVEADDLLVELRHVSTLFNRQYDNQYLGAIVTSLLGLVSGWSGGTVDNVGYTTVEFQGESVLSAIVSLAKGGGAHYRMSSTARNLDFGEFGADSGVRLVGAPELSNRLGDAAELAIIDSISILEEGSGIINKLIPVGAGQGESKITLKWVQNEDVSYPVQTDTNPDGSTYYYIEDSTSQSAYGTIEGIYKRNDIRPLSNALGDLQNAADALYNAALSFLLDHKDPDTSYRISVQKLQSEVLPGETVRVVYRGMVEYEGSPYKYVDIDTDLTVLSITDKFGDDGSIQSSLEVSASGVRPVSDTGLVAEMHRDLQVVRGQIQPNMAYNKAGPYSEEIAVGNDVTIDFRIGAEVLFLHNCKLRFSTRPLRATATGAEAVTTHTHNSIVINRVTTASLTSNDKELWFHQNDEDIKFNSEDAGPSTHTKTSSGGGAHSHNMNYGIFDDSNYPQGIEIHINGTDRTSALGGTWAGSNAAVDVEVDISEYLKDGNGDVIQQTHEIVFKATGSGAGGSTNQGVIFAQIDALVTVQAIAVS